MRFANRRNFIRRAGFMIAAPATSAGSSSFVICGIAANRPENANLRRGTMGRPDELA
jgi:hypothetical protein